MPDNTIAAASKGVVGLSALTPDNELSILILAALSPCLLSIWPFRKRSAPESDSSEQESDESPEVAETTLDFVEWGVRLAVLGKLDLAAQRFRRATEHDPDDAAAHYNLGLTLDQTGEHTEAVGSFARAAELAPDSLDARVSLGVSLLAKGDAEAAAKELEKAVQLAPEDPCAAFGLGCAYLAEKGHKNAVDAFRDAVRLDPKDPETRFNLAVALRAAGCPDLAENELQDFIALAGDRYPDHTAWAERVLAESSSEESGDSDVP